MFVFYVVLIQSTRATFGGLAVCIEQCVSLYAVISNANLLCFHLAFARKHHRLVYICCWCWTYYTMCDHKEDIIIVHLGAIWVPHRTNSICIYASMPPVLAHFETYIYIHIVLCESQRVGVPPAWISRIALQRPLVTYIIINIMHFRHSAVWKWRVLLFTYICMLN